MTGQRTAIVFGGSFNPPHLAHLLAVVTAQAMFGSEPGETKPVRVLVVPTFRHAFGKDLAPFEDRIALCEAAFAHVSNVEISRAEEEIHSEFPHGRTFDLLQHLRAKTPDQTLRLLIGADILLEAHRWHRWDDVCALAPPLVLGRETGSTPTNAPEIVLPSISSTMVRALLAGDPNDPRLHAWVPKDVLTRIRERGLYRPSLT